MISLMTGTIARRGVERKLILAVFWKFSPEARNHGLIRGSYMPNTDFLGIAAG